MYDITHRISFYPGFGGLEQLIARRASYWSPKSMDATFIRRIIARSVPACHIWCGYQPSQPEAYNQPTTSERGLIYAQSNCRPRFDDVPLPQSCGEAWLWRGNMGPARARANGSSSPRSVALELLHAAGALPSQTFRSFCFPSAPNPCCRVAGSQTAVAEL